jgi:hypothetical protein
VNRHSSRYNHRDANEGPIVKALQDMGVQWIEAGPLDGWVWLGQFVPVEIKTAKGKLTTGQKLFISDCELFGRPYRVWRTTDEAIEAVKVWRDVR